MPTETNIRQLAAESLCRIEVGGAFAGLTGPLQRTSDARLSRQATELIAGVTRRRRYLDFLIQSLYSGRFDKMEPLLKQILRVGFYELLVAKKPPHAVLYEAVGLAKRMVRPGAGRLANGLLRALLRADDALPVPDTADVADYLGILHSHPTWMVRRWLDRFGQEETERLLHWNNARPVYGVRCNSLKTSPQDFHTALDAAGVSWEHGLYMEDFVRATKLQPLLRGSLLQAGVCAIQDESAGLVVRLLDPQPKEFIIDTCAAPGGKALYAALMMQNRGRVRAIDTHAARLTLLQRSAQSHGVTIVDAHVEDLRSYAKKTDMAQADRVLLDAPCSGLGVLAKRADLRWNRTVEDLQELTSLQDALLDHAALLVRLGGLLVYSTCSTEPEENEQRVAAFLRRHAGYRLEPPSHGLPSEVITREGYLATLSHIHAVDGAFGARLRRIA